MNSLIRWGGLVLAGLGIAICLAALIAAWVYYPPAVQKTEGVYVRIDEALENAGARIATVEERVVVLGNLTAGYRANLRRWAVAEKDDSSHLGHRAELLASRVHQLHEGLEVTETLLNQIRHARKLALPFLESNETTRLDNLLDDVGAIRTRVAQAMESTQGLGLTSDDPATPGNLEERMDRALDEVIEVLDFVETADERLDKLGDKIGEVRQQSSEIEQEILAGLWWGRLGASIFFPWMAIGQLALGWLAWHSGRDTTSVGVVE